MMKSMIDDLELLINKENCTFKNDTSVTFDIKNSMSDSLLNGVKPKMYVPLLQRKRCGKFINDH